MRYGSICSGIEAATVAWAPLGWKAAFFSEIDRFPRVILKHHYPKVPLYGDFTKIDGREHGPLDILVGGTPCQSFSVAGLRAGMDDPRGNLALAYLALARRARPRWVVWENVPGVLSSLSHVAPDPSPPPDPLEMERDGQEMETEETYNAEEIHAFNAFLAGLSECGYGWAWRVLDAQYFGVAQRRRRVFVVGHLGDWGPAAAVLFEPESLRGDPAPSRKTQANLTGTLEASAGRRRGSGMNPSMLAPTPILEAGARTNGDGNRDGDGIGQPGDPMYTMQSRHQHAVAALTGDPYADNESHESKLVPDVSHCLNAKSSASGYMDANAETFVAHGVVDARQDPVTSHMALPLGTKDTGHAIAISGRARGDDGRGYARSEHISETVGTLDTVKPDRVWMPKMAVRRLTPRECERLQGFPDDYTLVDYGSRARARKIIADAMLYLLRTGYSVAEAARVAHCPDSPRYKALGNSMAVPVMAWLGQRIQMVHEILMENE